MRGRRGRGCLAAFALLGLTALLGISALTPMRAGATDSDLKHLAVLKVDASNGYSILVVASSERADGRGQVGLIVYGKSGSVTYGAPATITATRFEADLGALGEIALDVTPSGQKKTLRSRCADEPDSYAYEPLNYSGSFEFHGEEGYADASTAAPRDYTRFLFDVPCGGASSGEFGEQGLPGARLRLRSHRGSIRLNLQVNQNHPGARTRFEVETHEKRQGIAIERNRTLWVGSGAFTFDPRLRTATLTPPLPFAGRADFRRGAAPANRWGGNLTVDLPGRSNLPLTGSGFVTTLVRSCWQGEGAGSRADCGF